jgi:hypothetical protein
VFRRSKEILQEHIGKDLCNDNIHHIILGDFNSIVDPNLDRNPPKKVNHNNEVIKLLLNFGFHDTYRSRNPRERQYTWKRNSKKTEDNGCETETETRIDFIWASKKLNNSLEVADIIDATWITDSDHRICTDQFNLSRIIGNYIRNFPNIKIENEAPRYLYLLKEAEAIHWEKFRLNIVELLEGVKFKEGLAAASTQEQFNRIWSIIIKAITLSANLNIPNVQVAKGQHTCQFRSNKNKIWKKLRNLLKVCRDLDKGIKEKDAFEQRHYLGVAGKIKVIKQFNCQVEILKIGEDFKIDNLPEIQTRETLV